MFVTFVEKTSADAAVKGADGFMVNGKKLRVERAKPHKVGRGGGGRGGGGKTLFNFGYVRPRLNRSDI